MKKALLVVLILAVASCIRTNNSIVQPQATEDPNWIRLQIPTGREAFAIAGDIDKTLLVTTWTKAYYSTDRGQTWQESKDFQGPVSGLYVRNDTTFSLQSTQTDKQGFPIAASLVQYFTPDYGKTWDYYSKYFKGYLEVTKPIGKAQSTTGVSYSIKRNTTPVATGSTSFYENPSQLLRQDSNGQRMVEFPFQHRLVNLYLDTQDRLYVGASGGTFEAEHNSLYCCTPDMPAIIYVSRKTLP